MKITRKIAVLLVTVLCAMMFVGCSPSSGSSGSSSNSLNNQVLYDSNGVKITAQRMKYSSFSTDVVLLIENNSGHKITVFSESTSINGFSLSSTLMCDVGNGQKTVDSLWIYNTGLKDAGITSYSSISVSFKIYNMDSYSNFVTPTATIKL